MYVYKAYVDRIYDGDTVTCTVDCGFGVHLANQKIRLAAIDAPELRGPERPRGLVARDALRSRILGKTIELHTQKDAKGKYGRYVGTLFLQGENINDWLVENGYASRWPDA